MRLAAQMKGGFYPAPKEAVAYAALPQRLAALYFNSRGAHLFVRGDRDLAYQDVAQVIDMARGAGWQRIGLMTR